MKSSIPLFVPRSWLNEKTTEMLFVVHRIWFVIWFAVISEIKFSMNTCSLTHITKIKFTWNPHTNSMKRFKAIHLSRMQTYTTHIYLIWPSSQYLTKSIDTTRIHIHQFTIEFFHVYSKETLSTLVERMTQ